MRKPRISILLPVYNDFQGLERAMRSIRRQRSDAYALELLVIDDASDIPVEPALQGQGWPGLDLCVMRNPQNLGVARSRNLMLERASGDYIAFLDSDDEWLGGKLERQLAFLRETGCDIACTAYFLARPSRPDRLCPVPRRISRSRMLCQNAIALSSVLLRADALGLVRMRPEYAHEDYVFWLELLASGRQVRGLDVPLLRKWVTPSRRSANKRRAARNRWRVYRDFLRLHPLHAACAFMAYAASAAWKYR